VITIAAVAFIANQSTVPQWTLISSYSCDDYPTPHVAYNESYIGPLKDFDTTTDQFVITGNEWKISCTSSIVHSSSYFKIEVFDAYTDSLVKTFETPAFQTGGESFFNQEGRFYLHIYIVGTIEDWKVNIMDYKT